MAKAKRFFVLYCVLIISFFVMTAAQVILVDPYFHYHKPLTRLFYYGFGAQRYINDGITRHFDYDALITGTSMTENFKTSEFDEVFGCSSIKVPFSGGTYFEINNNQKVAFRKHRVRFMLRSLDYDFLMAQDKDAYRDNFDFPFYLYNRNPFDDTKYLFNKSVLEQCKQYIRQSRGGARGIDSFDRYSNWMKHYTFSRETVLGARTEYKAPAVQLELGAEESERIRGNIRQNVVELALAHPETQFYYFFPPYSIASWGGLYEAGGIEKRLQEEAIAIEMIVPCKNVHLFSFNTKFDWILNLDNYKDAAHYGEWINSEMLRLMKNDEYRITKDNAEAYLQEEREFYTNYDYNSIFADTLDYLFY